jgi:hypothetical protein
MITADSGGSNGSRIRLWKVELQKLANETGMEIHVSHFPPGTSKWNKIEHRLFSAISLIRFSSTETSITVRNVAKTTFRSGTIEFKKKFSGPSSAFMMT